MKCCAEKWHKKQFTNGDIVMLVSTVKEINFGAAKDCLYDIVTSQFNTSMEKKRLFRKAMHASNSRSKSSKKQKKKVEIRFNEKK